MERTGKLVSKRNIYIGIVVVLLAYLFVKVVTSARKSGSKINNNSVVTQESKPTAFIEINKVFEFKAIDVNKKEIPVSYTVVSAERKNDIKVKGEDRKPVAGKDYLLLRIEIQNSQTQRVAIATADRVRLDVNGKLFAPDYHNGNVVIDPISTKKDLLAFSVDSNQKTFVFQIGELDGEKQKVEVNF